MGGRIPKISIKNRLKYFLNLIEKDYLVYYEGHLWWKIDTQFGLNKLLDIPKQAGYYHKDYVYIGTTKNINNKKRYYKIFEHQLIYCWFNNLDDIPYGYEVNHKDGIKDNNYLDNLEMITCSENHKYAFKLGLQLPFLGSKNGNSKLIESQVRKIKKMLSTHKITKADISRKFNV